MSRDSDLGCVREILDCIGAIELAGAVVQHHDGDPGLASVFLDAVRYRLAMISDAVETLSPDLREDHPAVPWSDWTGWSGRSDRSDRSRLRDLIGDDDEGDPEMVRSAIGEPLRRLRSACRAILGESVRAGEDEP
jgi:uncharacterized protein with HEPN domain